MSLKLGLEREFVNERRVREKLPPLGGPVTVPSAVLVERKQDDPGHEKTVEKSEILTI